MKASVKHHKIMQMQHCLAEAMRKQSKRGCYLQIRHAVRCTKMGAGSGWSCGILLQI